ncbi:MAG TPA: aminotransferase class I/II-fold pyridoxal phosphate-dependent enzyme, partial [Rhabdochlamydiaceae bacterium]
MQQLYYPGLEVAQGNWLRLHRNENLFIDQKWLAEIAKSVAAHLCISHYPDSTSNQLRQSLGKQYNVDPDQIFIGNGSDEILAILLHYLRSEFDEAAISPTSYRVYPYLLQRYGYRIFNLESRVNDRLCLIDSPNAMTGERYPIEDIEAPFVIWDNVYGEFANDRLDLITLNSSRVIIRSFSKFYGLANLRIGYCFADKSLVQEMMKRKDIFNINGFAQEMALRVLEHKEYFDSLVPLIAKARHRLTEGLTALGFSLSHSETNCVWITHPAIS